MNRATSLLISFVFGVLVFNPAIASYDVATDPDRLTGTFGSDQGQPLTLGIWVKKTDWTATGAYNMMLSEDFLDLNSSLATYNGNTVDHIRAISIDSGAATASAQKTFSSASVHDSTWVCVVGVFTSDTDRKIYIKDSTQTASNTTSTIVAAILDSITVGSAANGNAPTLGLIAEAAIWSVALSTSDIDAYCGRTVTALKASCVNQVNLLGYWPLDTDQTTHTDQSGNGGPSLTEQSAIPFDADHPTTTGCAIAPLAKEYLQRQVVP